MDQRIQDAVKMAITAAAADIGAGPATDGVFAHADAVTINAAGLPTILGPGGFPVATGVELCARELATMARASVRKTEAPPAVDPAHQFARLKKDLEALRLREAGYRARTIRDLDGSLY